ncbi:MULTISPECIES: SIR2 family NAD-dependent protein deacylase [Luteimonas]|uniref:SIR2 family NAD-dependent protein deacylase n=1 Tax=Luteimonas TaxID=83614 RepID=UPI000C7BAE42|nr:MULTISPECIES: NAD-dependent deacylase [Luteimonas]
MRIAVLSGAGLSADSGIPTFRDALTGLWARFDPAELATEAAFRRDPALVWGWYRWRAHAVLAAAPNAGHRGIAALAGAGHVVRVVTQNVDDLHERAGSTDAIHLHGRLLASRCIDCGARVDPDPMLQAPVAATDGAREAPPRCAVCGGAFRPDVVWFGEPLPDTAWREAHAAIVDSELLVVVGTSALVWPAAGLPDVALQAGTPVVEINPMRTALSPRADAHWQTGAADGFARLGALLATAGPDIRRRLDTG